MSHTLTAPDLWQSARAMLNELFFLITGTTPAHLQRLKQRERKHVRDWLAALEAMVRKILLIEAAEYTFPPSTSGCAAAQARAGGGATLSRRAATSRRAPSFKLIPEQACVPAHPARIRMLGAPTSLTELLKNKARTQNLAALRNAPRAEPNAHLANRISALARVIANPITAIRALARRLRASRKIGDAIMIAHVATPHTFHGDAKLKADRGAINAMTKRDSS